MAKEEKRGLFGSLRIKLLLCFLALALIPVLVISVVAYKSSGNSLRTQFLNSFTAIVQSREDTLAAYLRGKIGRVVDFGSDGYIRDTIENIDQKGDDLAQLSEQLTKYLSTNKMLLDPEISEILLLDREGRVIASSNENENGKNMASDDYFIGGLKGTYVKDVYYSERIGKYNFAVSSPIKSRTTGRLLGVIVNCYQLAGINECITNREGMGKTGEVYIVNKDGYLITESRFLKDTVLKQKVDTEPVRLFQQERKVMTGVYPDYRGVQVVGASMGDDIEQEFGLGWVILAEMDTNEAFASVTTLRNWMLLIGLVTAGIVVAVAVMIARSITNPVRNLVDIAGIVAQGDLTAEIEIKSKDEIGQLAGSFKKMVGSLREVIGCVVAASTGVSASSQQLSSAAQESNATMGEISSAIDQLAKGAQSQAQRVEEMSKVMEQLNASISQSAKSSEEAASASAQASQSAQNGAKAVKTAIETMDKIENSTTITSQAVMQLGKRSEQMAQIVDVITNVADQTNLLALNAAIEAARAGEAGRGFAVVAEEVRKLAENSSKSAAEIDQLIKETISETDAAVKNMEISTKEVASGKELIANAGNTLEEIQQASESVSTMLQQISASSQQMAAGAKQVTKSVEEVAAISEQASSSTEQCSASAQQMLATMQEMASAAQSLSEMGVDLNTIVAKFKTGDEGAKAKSTSKNRPGKPMVKRLAEAKKKMDGMIHPKSPQAQKKVAVGSGYTEEGGYVND